MKTKIIVLALLLVLAPLGGVMAQPQMTIYDTLKASGNFKTLVTLIDKVNAKETKEMPGPFTMFAANDAAFAKLPPATMDKIMNNDALATNVVFFEIIPGKYMVKDLPELKECKSLCPAANAEPLRFTKVGDKYMVNDANIVQPDMVATNGVIQVVDMVLMPKMAPPHNP